MLRLLDFQKMADNECNKKSYTRLFLSQSDNKLFISAGNVNCTFQDVS